ncbi:MAG TPA: Lrp/AsnC family transcriptional regulator [Candidatus Bathyarchaeota archaeon]|nr:Lrp/AsnC family transcriptional regulator [Candidatus Bathyarchaeota archaeon]
MVAPRPMGMVRSLLASERRKAIVALLQENGRMSLTELGRALGISHVAAKKHLSRLLSSGLLKVRAGLSPGGLGAYLLVALCEVKHEKLLRLIRTFRRCPRVVFLSTLIGPYNFMAIMVAEDPGLVKIMSLGACCIRRADGIRRSELYVVDEVLYPDVLPIRVTLDKKAELTPCGLNCGSCDFYLEGRCPACPATRWYKGIL